MMSLQKSKNKTSSKSVLSSLFDDKSRSLFLGTTGTGKTTLAVKFLENINTAILLTDVKADVYSPKFIYMKEEDFDNLDDAELRLFVIKHLRSNYKICVRSSVLTSKEQSQIRMARLIIAYLKVLEGFKLARKGKYKENAIIFCLDELDLLAPKGASECLTEISTLSSKGRSVGAVLWGASQRAQGINNFIIGNTEQLYQFKVNKKDINNIDEYFEDAAKLVFDFENNPHLFYRSFKTKWSGKMKLTLKSSNGGK